MKSSPLNKDYNGGQLAKPDWRSWSILALTRGTTGARSVVFNAGLETTKRANVLLVTCVNKKERERETRQGTKNVHSKD